MENTPNPTKLAILIDAENVVASHADLIFAQAEAMGEIAAKEIYGTAAALTAWVAPVLKYAIHPNLTIRASKGKNSSDIALVIGAMDLLQAGMETIVIASSDSDFSALSVRLRNAGVNVIGMGTEKSNALWRMACSSFIVLEHPAPAPKPQSAPPAEAAAPAAAESAPKQAKKTAAAESAPKQAKKSASAKQTGTHKERMAVIQQFIEKLLDQNGGRVLVNSLFMGLNKLPEYKADRQGSGRKPLNYFNSTFADIFQVVNSADGKSWVYRAGADPLPAGDEPADEGAVEAPEVAEAGEIAMEPEETVMEMEEAAAEIEAPEESALDAEESPASEDAPEPAAEDAGDARPDLARRLIDGGMDAGVAERIAPLFEHAGNLRAAYNEIRKIYGNNDGRAYYHQAKAVIDAEG
ncbi:MAG: NYN domain-containing protein [Clostridia bacterium]|nr:NYN domain-containing protein [Clostridia bacterium]